MANSALDSLNHQLQPIYSNLTNLQGVQTNALAKQDDMLDIINYEQKRLQDKQNSIDQAVENQKRIIYFNDNSRKVYSAYLNILITIGIILGVIFVIRIIYLNFSGYIPEFVFNITMIAIMSIGLIIIFNIFMGIRSRDNYNFDELNLKPPTFATSSTSSPGFFNFGSLAGCIGSQCCTPPTEDTPGTKWNPSIGRCQFSPSLNTPISTENPVGTDSPDSYTSPLSYFSSSNQYIPNLRANETFETGYSMIE
jgi:hypothetical protein